MGDNISFIIVRPGGNDTAIVETYVPRTAQAQIAKKILARQKQIEQVLFLEQENGRIRGQMMGGEFCINAARALGYYLLNGTDGKIVFDMSGATQPVEIEVKNAFATATLWLRKSMVETKNDGIMYVRLEGIAHYVVWPDNPLYRTLFQLQGEQRIRAIYDWLKTNADPKDPASGLILADNNREAISILPFVWVRSTDTLYAETACGSGSLAVLLLQNETGRQRILQPSGFFLEVEFQKKSDGSILANIGGKVEILDKCILTAKNNISLQAPN